MLFLRRKVHMRFVYSPFNQAMCDMTTRAAEHGRNLTAAQMANGHHRSARNGLRLAADEPSPVLATVVDNSEQSRPVASYWFGLTKGSTPMLTRCCLRRKLSSVKSSLPIPPPRTTTRSSNESPTLSDQEFHRIAQHNTQLAIQGLINTNRQAQKKRQAAPAQAQ